MKIIKQGKIRTYTAKCIDCYTLFEFYRSEATSMTDRGEHVLLIKCPSCSKVISVYDYGTFSNLGDKDD